MKERRTMRCFQVRYANEGLWVILMSCLFVGQVIGFLSSSSLSPSRSVIRLHSSDSLESLTVKDLWGILEDANQVKPGLKSKLRRKQDIIDYISEHHDELSNENPNYLVGSDQETLVSNEEKDEEREEELLQNIDGEIRKHIPLFLAEKMIDKGVHSLLPIQAISFQKIYDKEDLVLQAPTGSGKTLAYLLPLLSRKIKSVRKRIAAPTILVIVPARELARQVGKEFNKYCQKSSDCATLHGGVPLERHASTLKRDKPRVIVGTPGRLREVVREGHLDYSQISTIVLDEADTLLDKADSPDVRGILQEIENAIELTSERDSNPEYQLLLVSATVNENIIEFARELEIPAKALIRVKGNESKVLVGSSGTAGNGSGVKSAILPAQHWHMSCKASARPSIAMDLVSVLQPRLTIIFVASKAEAESVASLLSSKRGGGVRVLHGDMVQSARSRSIALIREASLEENNPQILVATDVASRGLDLTVDLVLQFGIPRITGKEGTFSTELYTHRTGRTGRFNMAGHNKAANAITLYDPALGEGKLISLLASEAGKELGISIQPKHLPSTAEVVESGYIRATESIALADTTPSHNELTQYFRKRLESDENINSVDPSVLLEYLARAMTIISNLDASTSPSEPHVSLLSGSDSDFTLRLKRNQPLTPPEVIKICKGWGSGKLGRVHICSDGSAVFDLPKKRARKLIKTASDDESMGDLILELPSRLPDI